MEGNITHIRKKLGWVLKKKEEKAEGKNVLIVRHGERVDNVFGRANVTTSGHIQNGWTETFFKQNMYEPRSANLPEILPDRSMDEWIADPPITEIGYIQAKLIGRAIADLEITKSYSSPAYRCVRTLHGIIRGLQTKIRPIPKICLEPGLFEYGYFNKVKAPVFLKPDVMAKSVDSIDLNYKPYMTTRDINTSETLDDFHQRSFKTIRYILDAAPKDCRVLLCTHAPNFEPLIRQLMGYQPRPWDEYKTPMRKTSYLAMLALKQSKEGQWILQPPPVSPLTHGAIQPFDWEAYKALR